MPPVSEYDEELIRILFEIGPVKKLGMGERDAIGDVDLRYYMQNRGVSLTAYECELLREMSQIYCDMLAKAVEPNCLAPWNLPGNAVAASNAWAEWAKNVNNQRRAKRK